MLDAQRLLFVGVEGHERLRRGLAVFRFLELVLQAFVGKCVGEARVFSLGHTKLARCLLESALIAEIASLRH